jgi:regulator of RNase E activity RraA
MNDVTLRLPAAKTDLLHSGTLADVLDGFGWNGTFPSLIGPVNEPRRLKFLGQAYTVRWVPTRKTSDIKAAQSCTWDQVKDFLVPKSEDSAGLVYVAGTDTGALVTELALAGGFSATDFATRGFVALVLGGAIRDAHVVRRLPIPVWATGDVPADTQGSYRVIETGTWCNVGGQLVQTGDWIFGDETGLIKVPQLQLEQVLARAQQVEAVEDEILRRVSSGRTLFDVVAELGRL